MTHLELVSPSNKTTAAGREAYLTTWERAKAAGASLVEMDFVLQGRPMLEHSRDGLPTWDYAVTLIRASQPKRIEIYISTLRKRLPRFRLPLAATDRHAIVDSQDVFGRCCDRADFAGRINYQDAQNIFTTGLRSGPTIFGNKKDVRTDGIRSTGAWLWNSCEGRQKRHS